MKKTKKIVVAVLMMAMMVFALCSCGKNADGTYVISNLNGQSIDDLLTMYKEQLGQEMSAEEVGKLVISGENVTMSINEMGEKSGTEKQSPSPLTEKHRKAHLRMV